MPSSESPDPNASLAALFEAPHETLVAFSLPGGAPLYRAGEAADHLYWLRSGRLAVVRSEGGHTRTIGVVRPGEPVGEMALVAGSARTADVVALRDSEVLSLPADAVFAAAKQDPGIMARLARVMMVRLRQPDAQLSGGQASAFGLVSLDPAIDARQVAHRVAAELSDLGRTPVVLGVEANPEEPDWFDAVENRHSHVLYVAEAADPPDWRAQVGRQVDRLMLLAQGDRPPTADPLSVACMSLRELSLVDLLLVHPAGVDCPTSSEAWLDLAPAARLLHIRRGHAGDHARIARIVAGASIGLALSGGGARAYAHLGAIRALRERGCAIDFVGGASMGAIIAAGLAMGWDDEELEARIREAFVASSPVDDIAFPFISMSAGRKVQERLQRHFGERCIGDLWLPFLCVSADLTAGGAKVHRRGVLRDALRASIALPGVLPPVTLGDHVLVDGAVVRNLPADLVRDMHDGPVVAVDVTRSRGMTAADIAPPASPWSWLRSGEWRKGPPIVSVLMSAAVAASGREMALSREAADLLIAPKLERINIRDWKAFSPAVAAGYEAATKALDGLSTPLPDLRRHRAAALPM